MMSQGPDAAEGARTESPPLSRGRRRHMPADARATGFGSSPTSVAVASSLALMGDAMLYAVLPAQAATLGIPLSMVGVLLSANRFVRLFTNTWAASVYQRYGREWPFFIALVVASLTTLAYGLPFGLWVFLPARLLWGTCWSFLNVGMYLSVLHYTDGESRGRWMGLVKAISRIGTIVAVTVGAYLTDRLGFRPVVYALAVLAAIGAGAFLHGVRRGAPARRSRGDMEDANAGAESEPLRPAEQRPHEAPHKARDSGGRKGMQSIPTLLLYIMSFVFGFVMHGVIVGTLALLVVRRYGAEVDLLGLTLGAATASGLLLGARWVFEIGFAPLAGSVGDRLGSHRLLPLALLFQAAAIAVLAFVYDPILLFLIGSLIFLGGVAVSVCLDAVVGDAAVTMGKASTVMSWYVTAQDLGSAIGPLVGFLVGVGLGLEGLYLASALVSAVMAALFTLAVRRRRA